MLETLTNLVPTDTLQRLMLHKKIVRPYKTKFLDQIMVYTQLCNARSLDLKAIATVTTNNGTGSSSSSSASSSVPGKDNRVADEIKAWIRVYATSESIPAALRQSLLFRGDYTRQVLFPALALQRQSVLKDENDRRFLIQAMVNQGLLPVDLHAQYRERFPNTVSQTSETKKGYSKTHGDLESILLNVPSCALKYVANIVEGGSRRRPGSSNNSSSSSNSSNSSNSNVNKFWKTAMKMLITQLKKDLSNGHQGNVSSIEANKQIVTGMVLNTMGSLFVYHMNEKGRTSRGGSSSSNTSGTNTSGTNTSGTNASGPEDIQHVGLWMKDMVGCISQTMLTSTMEQLVMMTLKERTGAWHVAGGDDEDDGDDEEINMVDMVDIVDIEEEGEEGNTTRRQQRMLKERQKRTINVGEMLFISALAAHASRAPEGRRKVSLVDQIIQRLSNCVILGGGGVQERQVSRERLYLFCCSYLQSVEHSYE